MIKFVYFDVGGVLIKDFSGTNKWEDFMKGLGVNPSDHEKFDEFWKSMDVSTADNMNFIIPLINNKFSLNLPDNYDLLSDCMDRFEKNESIWPVVKQAKEECKIGLLTNQYPKMLDDIFQKGLMPEVEFDAVVDSSKEKLRKPCREIFTLAEELSGFQGSEILFIDNTRKNLIEPKKLGWLTYFYDSDDYEKSNVILTKYMNKLLQ